jgi:hypothetical protein
MQFLSLFFLVLSLSPPSLRYLLDGGTMSQGLKGIQSLTESDSLNESEE